jgi:choline dehydrogenase-like flavoprotein
MVRAVVIGSGAGGSVAARELALHGIKTLILEKGKSFKPLSRKIIKIDSLRSLLFSEKLISLVFPPLQTIRTKQGVILVRGMTTGGSTTIFCGSLLRAQKGLKELGLNLKQEFEEMEQLLKPIPIPAKKWRPTTKAMYQAAVQLGLNPFATPKVINPSRCTSCGLCELGCAAAARWDASSFIDEAIRYGAEFLTGARVSKIIHDGRQASGVEYVHKRKKQKIFADVIVLAAGGLGTAILLNASGLGTTPSFWGDVVLTLGGIKEDARQLQEVPMAWCVQKERYIISPYLDILSHFFHQPWRRVNLKDRVGVMIKLADTPDGSVKSPQEIKKTLKPLDFKLLAQGLELAREIMERAGVKGPFVRGMFNAGHLGGTAALGRDDVPRMRPAWLPQGLWIADLSLLPYSQGLPTVLTTQALALRVARKIICAI